MLSIKKIKIILSGVLTGLLLFNATAIARDISMELTLDRELVEVGDVIQLNLDIRNMQNAPAVHLPELDGFKSQYLGPSTQMTIINGKTTSSITHRYRLIAMQTGTFTIGPFSFTHDGDTYTSSSQQIKVVNRGQGTQQGTAYVPSTSEQSAAGDLDGKIFLVLFTEQTQAYLNERIPVTVKLYVSGLTVRDIQYPFFSGGGFTKEEFSQPRQYREALAGKEYDVMEFKTWLYPTKEGQITLGPAKMKCNIVVRKQDRRRGSGVNDFFNNQFFDDSFFSDFFGRVQVYPKEVTSAELTLKVLPFPDKDKPAGFTGAVGDFTMDVKAAPLSLKAGDPITLNINISGAGNLDSIQSPVPVNIDGFKVYAAEAQQDRGVKHFQQVIIPQKETITQIPEITFSFLNPETDDYISLKQPAISIDVLPPEEQGAKIIDAGIAKGTATPQATQVLGKDIIYIKEDIGPLTSQRFHILNNKIFLGLQLLPLLLLIGVTVFQKRRDRLSTDVRYARKLHAPKVARMLLKRAKGYLVQKKQAEFYDQIFKTLQQYLGHRFNRPSAGITIDVVDELIAGESLDREVGAKLKMCFSDCDVARYTGAQLDSARMQQVLTALEESIDYLERKKQ